MPDPGFAFDPAKGVEGVKLAVPFIHKWELFKPNAYQDVGGIWTIGYGFTTVRGKPVTKGMKMTKDEAEAEFYRQFGKTYVQPVNKAIKRDDVEPEMLAMLYSLAYNWGPGRVISSDIMKKINEGKFEEAGKLFPTGGRITVKGKVVKGLVNRRNAEMEIFLRGASRAKTKQLLASAEADIKRMEAPAAAPAASRGAKTPSAASEASYEPAAASGGGSRLASLVAAAGGGGGNQMVLLAAALGLAAIAALTLQRRGGSSAPTPTPAAA